MQQHKLRPIKLKKHNFPKERPITISELCRKWRPFYRPLFSGYYSVQVICFDINKDEVLEIAINLLNLDNFRAAEESRIFTNLQKAMNLNIILETEFPKLFSKSPRAINLINRSSKIMYGYPISQSRAIHYHIFSHMEGLL